MALAIASTAFLSHAANAETGTLPPVVVEQQQQKPQAAPHDKNKAVKKNQQRETPHAGGRHRDRRPDACTRRA